MRRAPALGLAAALGACAGDESMPALEGDTSGIDAIDDDDDGSSGPAPADTGVVPDLGQADDGLGEPACGDDPPLPFAIPVDPTCVSAPQIGTFEPVVEWARADWEVTPGARESATMPLVVQLTDDDGDGSIDADDVPDVLVSTYGNGVWLRGMSGDDGSVVLDAPAPGFSRGDGFAAADIDGDGFVEIVGIDDTSKAVAFEHDGTMKWTSVGLGGDAPRDTTPAFGDLDGDGFVEIVAGRTILDRFGFVVAVGEHGTGAHSGDGALSFPADVDGDGTLEVVVGDAIYRADGTTVWHHDEGDGFPAIADVDGDGDPEIAVVRTGTVRLHAGTDGALLWKTPLPSGAGGAPTIADFDGDGHPEIGVASLNAYSVFDGDGTLVWTNGTQDLSSGVTGSSVFDFEGDGIAEIVYADETRLWVFAGNDGAVKLEYDGHTSGTRLEYPVVADVDADGHAEIAVVHELFGGGYVGVTIIGDASDSWRPARGLWNQHAYHIGHVDDDGGVPVAPVPSWQTHNTFRAGDLVPNDGLVQPDLELFDTPCEACEDTVRIVWIQLGNGGAGPLSAGAELGVFGLTDGVETELDTLALPDMLGAGEVGEAIAIAVDTELYDALRVRATAGEPECDPTAAIVEIPIEPCTGFPPAG